MYLHDIITIIYCTLPLLYHVAIPRVYATGSAYYELQQTCRNCNNIYCRYLLIIMTVYYDNISKYQYEKLHDNLRLFQIVSVCENCNRAICVRISCVYQIPIQYT